MLVEIPRLEIDGSDKGDITCAVGMPPGTGLQKEPEKGVIRPFTHDVHEMQHWRKADCLSGAPHQLKHTNALAKERKN